MIDLECALISLRFVGLTITAEYLNGDRLLFHHCGYPFILDLRTGAIMNRGWGVNAPGMSETVIKNLRVRDDEKRRTYQQMSDHERALIYHANDGLTADSVYPDVIAAVGMLASRQVSGDELIKGLKALGLRNRMKALKLYSGGWELSACHRDGTWRIHDAEAFCKSWNQQAEEMYN
jgi:hypothetical protein